MLGLLTRFLAGLGLVWEAWDWVWCRLTGQKHKTMASDMNWPRMWFDGLLGALLFFVFVTVLAWVLT